MIDLKKLADYLVINLTTKPAATYPDLRELAQDFGSGIHGLWSDAEQGVVAFAFDAPQWTEAQAKQWVKDAQAKTAAAEDKPMPYQKLTEANPAIRGIEPPVTLAQANLIAAWADAMEEADDGPDNPWAVAIANFKKAYEVQAGAWVQKEAKAATSFEETRRMVEAALVKRYGADNEKALLEVWLQEIGPRTAIYHYRDDTFAVDYTLTDGQVTLGESRPAQHGWKELETGKAVQLHAFDSHLASGAVAAEEGDGLVWKEIIKPGAWFKMDSGRRIEVTRDIIKQAVRAFNAGLPKLVSVPADSHHSETRGVVPAESNRGFVQKVKEVGDSLFGGFRLTDQQIAAGVQDGSIADCSVYLQPDVTHPQTGEKFPWVLRHVLLTNNPLVTDLRPFGDIPAAGEDQFSVVHYRQEVEMPEKQEKREDLLATAEEILLTGDAAQEYGALAALGLTAAEIRELAAQRTAIQAQAAELQAKAREMEVVKIVKALEAQGEHSGVTQIAGRRHFPVVIAAIEQALRDAPPALALDGDADGVTPLDAALLAVVNAIPEAGRLPVTADAGADKRPRLVEKKEEVTDAQVDAFLKQIA